METVITDGAKYLYIDKSKRYSGTTDINRATKFEYKKANNLINNNMSQRERKKWHIEPLKNTNHIENDVAKSFNINWENQAKLCQNFSSTLMEYRTSLSSQLSTIDREICDINHYIELFCLDAAKGYKAYKMLRDKLIQRRLIKNEQKRADIFLNFDFMNKNRTDIKQQLISINNQDYEPRVLKELFDV